MTDCPSQAGGYSAEAPRHQLASSHRISPCNSALGSGRRAVESRALTHNRLYWLRCSNNNSTVQARRYCEDLQALCAPGFCGKRVTPFCLALLTAAWAREKSAFSSGSLARIFSAARQEMMGRRGGWCVILATKQFQGASPVALPNPAAQSVHQPQTSCAPQRPRARCPPAPSAPAEPGCGVLMGWSATQHRMMSQITFQGASVFTPSGLACVPDTLRHGSGRGVRVHALAARPPAKAPPQPTPFRHGPDTLPAFLIPATSSLLHTLQQGIQQTHEHAHR